MRFSSKGFTLVEMVVVVLIIGSVSLAISPLMSTIRTSQTASYRQSMMVDNQRIGDAMVTWAETISPTGRLPIPYTATNFNNAIPNLGSTDPLDMALVSLITASGVPTKEINDDGYASTRVRVYQLQQNIAFQTPLFGRNGPLMNLQYDFGFLNQTACSRGTSCNTTVPGTTPALTASNIGTISTVSPEFGDYAISTMALQRKNLADTASRLNRIRDEMLNYAKAKAMVLPPTDTTNWYPTGASSLAGQDPSSLQGCRDGWYDLNTDSVILNTVGLQPSYFGLTTWGGIIQYCRDYDPATTKGANGTPHYGALRINKNASSALAPSTSTLSDNVVISF